MPAERFIAPTRGHPIGGAVFGCSGEAAIPVISQLGSPESLVALQQ